MHETFKFKDFFAREVTILAAFESTRRHVCILSAIKALDVEAKVLEDSANLAITTFADTDHYVGFIRRVDGYFARLRWPILELDTRGNSPRLIWTERLIEHGLVDAQNAVARVHQTVCELTIIGEKQHTCSVPVEASHGEETCLQTDNVEDGCAPLFIAGRRDDILWLIEHDVGKVLVPRDWLTVDRDHVVDLDLGSKFNNDATVDFYSAGTNQFIGTSTRCNTCIGDGLVESLWRIGRFVFAVSLGLLACWRGVLLRALGTLLALGWTG